MDKKSVSNSKLESRIEALEKQLAEVVTERNELFYEMYDYRHDSDDTPEPVYTGISNPLSAEMQQYYDKRLLECLSPADVGKAFGAKEIAGSAPKTLVWRRYNVGEMRGGTSIGKTIKGFQDMAESAAIDRMMVCVNKVTKAINEAIRKANESSGSGRKADE